MIRSGSARVAKQSPDRKGISLIRSESWRTCSSMSKSSSARLASAMAECSERSGAIPGIPSLSTCIVSRPLHPSSASSSQHYTAQEFPHSTYSSTSRSSSARLANATPECNLNGVPCLSSCIVSRPLHPSSASSSQLDMAQVGRSNARCEGFAPRHLSKPFGTDTDLLSWQIGGGAFDDKSGGAIRSKKGRIGKKQYRTIQNSFASHREGTDSSDEEYEKEHYIGSVAGLAGLPSRLSKENKRADQLKQLKQQSKEAANLRGITREEQPQRHGIHTNPNARLYQSSVGELVFGANPNDSIDDSLFNGSAGMPTWSMEPPRNKKPFDPLQMQTVDTQSQPKLRGTRHYESQERETASLLCDDGQFPHDDLRAKRAEIEFSQLHEGSAGNRTWFEPPQRMQRDFSKAPHVKSIVDIVVFGRDVDLEGETPWSADFTKMYEGLAGRPTWAPEHRRALRHVDHPSNHWSGVYESDPWRGKVSTSPKKQPEAVTREKTEPADIQHTRNAPVGYAGLPSWEETQCTYHRGPRKIVAPTALNETFYMDEEDLLREPPREWASNAFAGTRSWEKRAKEDMEIRADNAQRFFSWTSDRPDWKSTRRSRSNPPRQGNARRSHNSGNKRAFVRNRSVSPRSARALAGG